MPRPTRRLALTATQRAQRRTAALDLIAREHGYPTWCQLGTAVRQGKAKLIVTRLK